jgi:hypothetical protein
VDRVLGTAAPRVYPPARWRGGSTA